MLPNPELGIRTRLRLARLATGLTLRDAAKMLAWKWKRLQRLERGVSDLNAVDVVRAIDLYEMLGASVDGKAMIEEREAWNERRDVWQRYTDWLRRYPHARAKWRSFKGWCERTMPAVPPEVIEQIYNEWHERKDWSKARIVADRAEERSGIAWWNAGNTRQRRKITREGTIQYADDHPLRLVRPVLAAPRRQSKRRQATGGTDGVGEGARNGGQEPPLG